MQREPRPQGFTQAPAEAGPVAASIASRPGSDIIALLRCFKQQFTRLHPLREDEEFNRYRIALHDAASSCFRVPDCPPSGSESMLHKDRFQDLESVRRAQGSEQQFRAELIKPVSQVVVRWREA